jgi:hypothetical protein
MLPNSLLSPSQIVISLNARRKMSLSLAQMSAKKKAHQFQEILLLALELRLLMQHKLNR